MKQTIAKEPNCKSHKTVKNWQPKTFEYEEGVSVRVPDIYAFGCVPKTVKHPFRN